MYAHALLPRLATGVEAYPALAELLLPAGLLGVFYCGMIATVMSTVDAYLFNAGITLSRDLLGRVGSAAASTLRGERLGLFGGAALAAGVALASESVVNLWYGFGSVGTAVLLLPILGAFFPALRGNAGMTAVGMAAAGGVSLAWVMSAQRATGPWLSVEPVYAGLVVAAAATAAGIMKRRLGSRPRA
jgi:SSS family solute:Na+ symporter